MIRNYQSDRPLFAFGGGLLYLVSLSGLISGQALGRGPDRLPVLPQAMPELAVERIAPKELTIGAACSPATPCNYRFGSVVSSLQGTMTVTFSGTERTKVFVYLSQIHGVVVGHNSGLRLTCRGGCTVLSGIKSFPPNSIPLAIWGVNAVPGEWDPAGQDKRAVYAAKPVTAGAGLAQIENPIDGSTQLQLDRAIVGFRVRAPKSSTSACNPGDWAADEQYLYTCVAPNKWRRLAHSDW